MLALQKVQPSVGGIALEEVSDPGDPEAGQVLVEIMAAGICGSDVHVYEWTPGYEFMTPHMPLTLGHELSGEVKSVGAGSQHRVGDRVTVVPSVPCGKCPGCRLQDVRNCSDRKTIGVTATGGFARYMILPDSNCMLLAGHVPFDVGALTEPLGVGCEAVLTGGVGLGDTVLVLGPGTIGQALALMARAAGASRVIVTGRNDASRFAVLRELGFADLIDTAAGPLVEQFRSIVGDGLVDVVLEATGIPQTITEALDLLKPAGVLVPVGIHPHNLDLPLTKFVRMRHQLRGSHGTSRSTWRRVINLIEADPARFAPMITHRMALDQGIEAFALASSKKASKVILQP